MLFWQMIGDTHEIIQSRSKTCQINKLQQTYTIYICLKMFIVAVKFNVIHKCMYSFLKRNSGTGPVLSLGLNLSHMFFFSE